MEDVLLSLFLLLFFFSSFCWCHFSSHKMIMVKFVDGKRVEFEGERDERDDIVVWMGETGPLFDPSLAVSFDLSISLSSTLHHASDASQHLRNAYSKGRAVLAPTPHLLSVSFLFPLPLELERGLRSSGKAERQKNSERLFLLSAKP